MSKLDNIVEEMLAFNNLDGWAKEDLSDHKQRVKDLMREVFYRVLETRSIASMKELIEEEFEIL